jgi:SPP1 family predicted phage head-tail adaptor
MNISGLRVRVTFQRNTTVEDEYANHTSVWTDWFSCWATVVDSGKSAEETEKAATTNEDDRLDITVRWSTETAAVNSKEYRILVGGRIYNIIGTDEMGYRKNSRKFHTILTKR